jgi:hypothetical protein
MDSAPIQCVSRTTRLWCRTTFRSAPPGAIADQCDAKFACAASGPPRTASLCIEFSSIKPWCGVSPCMVLCSTASLCMASVLIKSQCIGVQGAILCADVPLLRVTTLPRAGPARFDSTCGRSRIGEATFSRHSYVHARGRVLHGNTTLCGRLARPAVRFVRVGPSERAQRRGLMRGRVGL